jgi:hypothetical protein
MAKKYKYKVGYLIDVVSKNPADYTRYREVQADDEADAIREAAKLVISSVSNRDWIDSLEGTPDEIKEQLLSMRQGVYTTIEKIQ